MWLESLGIATLSWSLCYSCSCVLEISRMVLNWRDPPSQIHEKDLLALKKAVLNSWTAWFTECRWETKMVAFGYLIVWNSGVHISERNNQWATHLFRLGPGPLHLLMSFFRADFRAKQVASPPNLNIAGIGQEYFTFILLCTYETCHDETKRKQQSEN